MPSKMMIVLVVACIAGLAILHSRFTGNANRNGGIGRYQSRGDNAQAWKEFDSSKSPSPDYLRGYVCAGAKANTMCWHSVLPSDNLRHVLISMRSSEGDGEPSIASPVEGFASVIQQETGLMIKGRLNDQSTLKDVLLIWNELAAQQQSASSSPREPSEKEKAEYQAYRDKEHLDSINRAMFNHDK